MKVSPTEVLTRRSSIPPDTPRCCSMIGGRSTTPTDHTRPLATEPQTSLLSRPGGSLPTPFADNPPQMWPSVLPLDKKWKPLLYPRPEPSLYSKPSKLWGQTTLSDLTRLHGVAMTTIYRWKAKYGGMTKDETRKFRQLEAENQRLKKLVADLSLDNAMLKEVVGRKW